VDEFVEHGEVQEGCTVKGKHMTFLSDMFGMSFRRVAIFSSGQHGGRAAESQGGNVTLASGFRALRFAPATGSDDPSLRT